MQSHPHREAGRVPHAPPPPYRPTQQPPPTTTPPHLPVIPPVNVPPNILRNPPTAAAATAGPPEAERTIPSFDELRSSTPRAAARLDAPNLTTYIEHYHYYHFAGNCTVYQAPDRSGASRGVQIVSERPHIARHPSAPDGQPQPVFGPPTATTTGANANAATAPQGHVPPPPPPPPPPPTVHHQHHSYVLSSMGPYGGGAARGSTLPHAPPAAPTLPAVSTLASGAAAAAAAGALFDQGGRLKRALGPLEQRSAKRARSISLPSAAAAAQAAGDLSRRDARSTSDQSPQRGGAGTSNSSSLSRSPKRGMPENSDLLLNDWEHVVAMYMTGEGTNDGRPLRDITRGDGRRVEDRKLLEKRRTIGKTYERLGRDLFERAIGYKLDGKYRRKQRMYHVIARCRVVNGLRKEGKFLPTDADELTALIDHRLMEKANAAKRGNQLPHGLSQPQPQPQHLPLVAASTPPNVAPTPVVTPARAVVNNGNALGRAHADVGRADGDARRQ